MHFQLKKWLLQFPTFICKIFIFEKFRKKYFSIILFYFLAENELNYIYIYNFFKITTDYLRRRLKKNVYSPFWEWLSSVVWISLCMVSVSTKASRQSTLGYTHGSSLSVNGAQTTNSMVTQDTDMLFIQVRPPSWRNTYVLRLIVLICVERIIIYGGSPASPYIVRRTGLQIWKLILVGYNCHR